jgi:hypothetical protein
MGEHIKACRIYDKIIEIWTAFINDTSNSTTLNEAQQTEAIQMLHFISDTFALQDNYKTKSPSLYGVISTLHLKFGDEEKAKEFQERAEKHQVKHEIVV